MQSCPTEGRNPGYAETGAPCAAGFLGMAVNSLGRRNVLYSGESWRMTDPAARKASDTRTDEELVARFQAGDARAFGALVEIHLDRVFALAVELVGRREDAEEVTQEVLIKLYRQLSRAGAPARLRPWLYRVCIRHCCDWRRSRRRQPVSLELDAANGSRTSDPATAAENLALRESVRAALSALPQQQRMAFLLRHLAGLSTAEVAAALRCAPATVRVHLSRATGRLRDALSSEVNVSESL